MGDGGGVGEGRKKDYTFSDAARKNSCCCTSIILRFFSVRVGIWYPGGE